jgi:hypothetical protein
MMVSRCSSMILPRAPMAELTASGELLRPYRWPAFKPPTATTQVLTRDCLKGPLPLRSSFTWTSYFLLLTHLHYLQLLSVLL